MPTLHIEQLDLPVAPVGPVNPLPPLAGLPDAPYQLDTGNLPAELVRNARYGRPRTLMPYLIQDGYHRHRQPGSLRMAVLDNGILRASFALDLGGRLWSLTHLPSGRELLYRNPVLQPANLALRNAWFSGGVEWNIGTRGHSPTTCAPLHAATVDGPQGTPMLRMWEYERLRGLVFSVDAWLPGGSDHLLVHIRIRNPRPDTVPVYWWSNIAVPEDVRVLAPATRAFHTSYDGTVRAIPVPIVEDTDRSYPPRNPHAADYFFDLPPEIQRPWIVAVDGSGQGLAQTSTARLRGRKLFVWGRSTGGRHWADWLSPGNPPYAEIQAGLAATQFEHLPIPPGAVWDWVETYGPIQTDPALIHQDWSTATTHTAEILHRQVPTATLTATLAAATARADHPPAQILHHGTGWGALERHRRRTAGEPWFDDTGTPFPDATLTAEQHPWLTLLTRGALPDLDPLTSPLSYPGGAGTEPYWSNLLADHPGWLPAYHRAVLAHQRGDHDTARTFYTRSLDAAASPWALRGLALLDLAAGNHTAAADHLHQAHQSAPTVRQLATETAEALLSAARPADCRTLLESLPPDLRRQGRIQLLELRAALALGDLTRARQLLTDGIEVPDLREGEETFDHLWAQTFPDQPLPPHYDFRMH